jgi:sporulation protein YlmC with PRC-barrel domain
LSATSARADDYLEEIEMKPSYRAAASSAVLAFVLAAPAVTAMAAEELSPPAEAQGSQLATKRVKELEGTKVINEKGEEIGSIDAIVRGMEADKNIYAVVSVGGFLGIGEHDVTIALHDLALRGGRLMVPPGTTKDQLKNMPEYDKSKYEKLPGEQVVTIGARTIQKGGSR